MLHAICLLAKIHHHLKQKQFIKSKFRNASCLNVRAYRSAKKDMEILNKRINKNEHKSLTIYLFFKNNAQ